MQRVFNAECEKDVKELFELIPDSYTKIVKNVGNTENHSTKTLISHYMFLKINWGDLTEIKRPEKNKIVLNEIFTYKEIDRIKVYGAGDKGNLSNWLFSVLGKLNDAINQEEINEN